MFCWINKKKNKLRYRATAQESHPVYGDSYISHWSVTAIVCSVYRKSFKSGGKSASVSNLTCITGKGLGEKGKTKFKGIWSAQEYQIHLTQTQSPASQGLFAHLRSTSANNLTSTSCLLANTRMGTPSRASLVIIFSVKNRKQNRGLTSSGRQSCANTRPFLPSEARRSSLCCIFICSNLSDFHLINSYLLCKDANVLWLCQQQAAGSDRVAMTKQCQETRWNHRTGQTQHTYQKLF